MSFKRPRETGMLKNLQQLVEKIVQYFSEICRDGSQGQISGIKKQSLPLSVFVSRAFQGKGKHNDGIRQRDFVCEHKSYDKYLIKKTYVSLL